MITGLYRVLPIRGLCHELMLPQVGATPIWSDAAAVLQSANGGASLRNTPWLLARTAVVVEATEEKIVKIRKIDGLYNPPNSLTKYTPQAELQRDVDFMTNAVARYDGSAAAQRLADGAIKGEVPADDALKHAWVAANEQVENYTRDTLDGALAILRSDG